VTGTRRRGAELEATILDAAWAELAETGYARLTMENVAARAKTGKQVLYRRWANRAELVIAAMRHHSGSIVQDVPDTGDLRRDVLTVLRHGARRQQELGTATIRGLMADLPELDPAFFTQMRDVMAAVLRRAAERGEVDADALPDRVVSLPMDLLRHEMLMGRAPVPAGVLTSIADDVFLPLVRRAT
jgi:AcrR family transcriptional regulator